MSQSTVSPAGKRLLTVAAAQLGPIHLATPRSEVLQRMCALLDQAATTTPKVQVVVFPELAFTTFFPRHFIPDEAELNKYFEPEGPENPIEQSPNVKPLLDHAKKVGIDIYVGYAESWTEMADAKPTTRQYNAALYFSSSEGKVIGKYRKVHLPGVVEPFPEPGATQQLEKRYFTPGDLGFPAFRAPNLVDGTIKKKDAEQTSPADSKSLRGKGDPIFGMLICNDRRWAEGWRAYGMQGTEVVFCGYNTTAYAPQLLGTNLNRAVPLSREETEKEVLFHNRLSVQGNSYMNACFSVNVAKAGTEDGHDLIAGTCIVDPNGYVLKESSTKDDELVVQTLDLNECRRGKGKTFDFDRHRRPEMYEVLTQRAGVEEPEFL